MSFPESDLSRLEQAVIDFNQAFFENDEIDSKLRESSLWKLAHKICSGQFIEAVFQEGTPLQQLLKDQNQLEGHESFLSFRDSVEDILTLGSSNTQKHMELLFGGVAALMVFVQSNWTGPPLDNPPVDLIAGISAADALVELTTDGETAYKKVSLPQYMLLAKIILFDNSTYFKNCKSVTWWSARFGFKLQGILSGPSETLRNFINSQFNKSMFAYSERPEILLEFGLVYHYYKDGQRAREYLLKAKSASKLYCELSGVMGRRTKYQTFDTPQLVLLAQSHKEGRVVPEESQEVVMTPSHYVEKDSLEAYLETPVETVKTFFRDNDVLQVSDNSDKKDLPSEVKPDDDDIRLKAPKLADDSKSEFVDENLKIIDQCILAGLCLDVRNENPRHGLTHEQMKAYVERVMKHPNNWMVHSMALLIKSRLETHTSKYIDRAAVQLQVLVDQFKEPETAKDYPTLIRCQRIFHVLYPPVHRLKAEIGELYLKLGVARSALHIFEELEMWTEAVQALQICGEDQKARALIQKRFEEEGETPELLCLLGDVHTLKADKCKYYQRCWEVSRGKYPRAKRQLGRIAMDDHDFQGAITHYKEALAVNPQYGFAWFRLGCCALEIQDWAQAQHAFTRTTYLHPDDAEAWSNLAAACLKLGLLKEAHSAFKEALKHNQDNWRIWDNYMVSSVKLGYVQEAIYCLHKLLELNTSVDVEILDILVRNLTSRFKIDDMSSESQYVHKQLRTLLGRITSQISNNPDLWDVYAKYHTAIGDSAKAVEYRQKQCRALQSHGWETDLEKFKKVVAGLELLVAALEAAQDKSAAYSTKLQLKSSLKKVQEVFGNTDEYKRMESLVTTLESIK